MIKPEPQVMKAMGNLVRHHPDFLQWMQVEYQRELEKLPFITEHTAVAQGRCQVWKELVKLFEDAPAIAAKL